MCDGRVDWKDVCEMEGWISTTQKWVDWKDWRKKGGVDLHWATMG